MRTVPTKAKNRPIPARRLAPGQSVTRRTKVANGKSLLAPEGNANGWWARRFGEILALRFDDMGGGDLLSEGQISLAKRATTLEVELERMDANLSNGTDVDLDLYARITGTLARVLEKLGLERVKPRSRNPLLDHFSQPHGGVST